MLTHLIFFEFFPGATDNEPAGNFGGSNSLPPYFLFDGFSDADAPPPPTPTPDVPTVIRGTSGVPGHYGKRLRKPRRGDDPLDYAIDKEAFEYYQEILASRAPPAVIAEAKAIVRPFAGKRKVSVESVDWGALEQEASVIASLMRIWQREVEDEDDTIWLLLNG